MNDRKFSLKAEHVLRCAQAAAGELGHGYVGCEHLLLAMRARRTTRPAAR